MVRWRKLKQDSECTQHTGFQSQLWHLLPGWSWLCLFPFPFWHLLWAWRVLVLTLKRQLWAWHEPAPVKDQAHSKTFTEEQPAVCAAVQQHVSSVSQVPWCRQGSALQAAQSLGSDKMSLSLRTLPSWEHRLCHGGLSLHLHPMPQPQPCPLGHRHLCWLTV